MTNTSSEMQELLALAKMAADSDYEFGQGFHAAHNYLSDSMSAEQGIISFADYRAAYMTAWKLRMKEAAAQLVCFFDRLKQDGVGVRWGKRFPGLGIMILTTVSRTVVVIERRDHTYDDHDSIGTIGFEVQIAIEDGPDLIVGTDRDGGTRLAERVLRDAQ